jgi:hypothetical protein
METTTILVAFIGASATILAAVIGVILPKIFRPNKGSPSDKGKLPDNMPLDNIRNQNEYFIGRDEKLAEIRQKLQDKKGVYVTGMGGVGKSSIVLEYGYRHKAEYEVMWWINAETPESVQAGLKKFAFTKLFENDELNKFIQAQKLLKEDELNGLILTRIREWLNNNPKWLFIYDNADADSLKWLGQYLSQSNAGDVVVTTRSSNFSNFKKITLDEFTESEALAFLEKRTTEKFDNVKAKDLAKCLGYLPLALEQAAAYIDATDMATYEKYIEDHDKKLDEDDCRQLTNAYDKTIYATLQISIDKIKKEGAKQMLNVCAYFAPEKIPVSLFVDSKVFSEIFKDDTPIEDIVAELKEYSLLKCDKDSQGNYFLRVLLKE